MDEYENLLNANPIWIRRTQGVGCVPVEDLLDLGVTGPMIRAAGIPWDIRKSEPYSSYEKFDFNIADATDNDVWRGIACAWKSCGRAPRIVQQALEARCPRRSLEERTSRTWCCPTAKR